MTKDKASTNSNDQARPTGELFRLDGSTAPQLGKILDVQESILEEVEDFAEQWFKRRHDATQKMFQTLQQVNSAQKENPVAAIQAVTEWQRGSFERLSADMKDWTALCMRCAGVARVASGDAGLDGSGKTDSKAASGAGQSAARKGDGKADGRGSSKSGSTGHATPV